MEEEPVANGTTMVCVPSHPLIKHWISVLRNEQTPCATFKNAMAELGRLLIYEASRDWLPVVNGEIQTPMGVATVEYVDPHEPIMIVPILRAGLALAEHASSVLPATRTYHLDYLTSFRRGGTVIAAVDLLKDRGAEDKQIKVISAIAAPPALRKLSQKFPGLHVYTGIVDPILNEKGFIVPGLGDAGDRSFGT
ncbi:hypothetical protein C4D60_Mb06t06150 [Musa balbisiana]|uniref:uracil phosphoribosyltransferase n=1 Tax=Musa balbisiana TaxID=52838 RepID=A0A4V4H3Q0_MUSBA|nr:hypothetical protein C4D60_Mb06t06150 [Musa balbisiana]